jgi:hypothetical protein
MLNKLTSEASLLNKGSCLTPALGIAKFIIIKDMILITIKPDLDVQQTHL